MDGVWLMVGSSPSVENTLPMVRDRLRDKHPTIITCNSGIKIVHAAYYVCVEMNALKNYANLAVVAQECGTKLVTLDRSHRRTRNIHWYNEFIENKPGPPTRDKYGEFRRTGGLTLEYAVRNGAKEVHLVGVDGHKNENDYFDGETLRRITKDSENTVLQELYQQIADCFPEVRFIQYGDPVLRIESDNWEVEHWSAS